MVNLQLATRSNSRETFKKYTKHVDLQNKMVTLRGMYISILILYMYDIYSTSILQYFIL